MTSKTLFVVSFVLLCTAVVVGHLERKLANRSTKSENQRNKITNDIFFNTETNMKNLKSSVMIHNFLNNYDENGNEKVTNFNTDSGINKASVVYNKEDKIRKNLELHKINIRRIMSRRQNEIRLKRFGVHDESKDKDFKYKTALKRTKRQEEPDVSQKCDNFQYNSRKKSISHPLNPETGLYYKSVDCYTNINVSDGSVIQLTFVDMFRVEHHPECKYDYLEIRDGIHGYAKLLGKLCGEAFPVQITSSGPSLWLKFHSDDTIEYEGFHINVEFSDSTLSHRIPEACFIEEIGKRNGYINTSSITSECSARGEGLDVLWMIETPPNTKIFLNFTSYKLASANNCEENVLQVFGSFLEYDHRLAHYCGLVANSVTTKEGTKGPNNEIEKGNKLYVRLYTTKSAKSSEFSATYTAFKSLNPNEGDKCADDEFDCEDNTCIDISLKCDRYANCRLKTDEEVELCKTETESIIQEAHILVILVIFSLILSGMSFVFLFKCIKKLYEDHKIIKEHIRQSCEDRLDTLVASRLTLDAKRLEMDSEPRASLERENHTNEMFKQRKNFKERKVSSIDSDFIQETNLDLDDEPWRREVDSYPIEEEVKIERNGRLKRTDTSRKEESIRSKSRRSSEENRVKKEIRDASVAAPDVKESACQTRESLFQTGAIVPGSESTGTESGSNSRGFSTFGYSGTTIVRPSPPASSQNTAEITIELLSQVPHQDSVKSQKKCADRRPMSTETTRSAPDVIIVSKPIR